MHPTCKRRTLPLAGAVALAVAPVALFAPMHSVTRSVAEIAPATSSTPAPKRFPTVLPAPHPQAAPVVVTVPDLPPLPSHGSSKDAPALQEHANVVRAQLTTTAVSRDDASRKVAQATQDVAQARARLQAIREKAAAVGAPTPEIPPMPKTPEVTTPSGTPVAVAVTAPSVPAVVAAPTTAAEPVTVAAYAGPVLGKQVPPANSIERTFAQANIAQEAKGVQAELAAAQVQLVTVSVVAQVTDHQVATLADALSSTEQAIATLPPPDPRGPEGCPGDAPAGTLRNGAANIGLAKLCADSVAAAPSPEAAKAVKWALSHLGMPYSQSLRNSDGYADCSSFVTRAYQAAGVPIAPPGVNAPTTQTIASAPWAINERFTDLRPGDLVEPDPGHVVMWLADGFMVHTSTDGDVSHVRSVYFGSGLALRVDPSQAH